MKEKAKRLKVGDVFMPPFKGLPWKQKCVYRLNYKGGYFYIGSTVCLAGRLSEHKTNGRIKHRHPIKKIMQWENVVSVEVLQTGRVIERLRRAEEKLIFDIFLKISCVNMMRKYVS